MSTAIVTDLHFGVRSNNLAVAEKQKEFYDMVFFPYLDSHPEIDRVIDGGDSFDHRKSTDHLSLHIARTALFDRLQERGIETDVLVGNHDMYYRNNLSVNAPSLFFAGYSNINVITKPTELQVHGKSILALPWICSENAMDTMHAIQNSNSEVCIGHLELSGFEMYRGQMANGAMNPSIFKKFDMVLSGHYHHRSSKGNVHYLGSPYEMTWADFDDPRGFHVLNMDHGNRLEFIENPVKLFRIIEYDDTGMTDVSQVESMIPKDLDGRYVKIVIKNKTNPVFLDKLVDIVETYNPVNAQIVDAQYMSSLTSGTVGDVADDEDVLSTVFRYLDSKNAGNERADELKSMLKDLYIAAQQSVVG